MADAIIGLEEEMMSICRRDEGQWLGLSQALALLVMIGLAGHVQAGPTEPDFSIAVPTAGCSTNAGSTSCFVLVGTQFTVELTVDDFDGFPNGYTGWQGRLNTSAGLALQDRPGTEEQGSPTEFWPECDFPADTLGGFPPSYLAACAVTISGPSTYTGLLMQVDYECPGTPSTETVTLVHGPSDTFLSGDATPGTEAGPDILTIECVTEIPEPQIEQTKEKQKCIVEMNKNVAKVAKAQGKDICKCIKDGAKGKLVGQSIEQCTTADNKGKVAKAKAKLKAKVADKCPTDPNSLDAPDFGAETPPDPNFHIQAAIDAELSLVHWIFGSDLDEVILPAKDPNDPSVKPTSKCQINVAKAAKKCFDTKWKVFIKCKKNGLKGKTTLIGSAQKLRDECLGTGTAAQPDPKGKIAKACGTKLQAKVDKKCGADADRSRAFPLFDPNASDLRTFVDQMVECEFCRLVNEVDGLDRDCDLFDDGLANGSCGGGCVAFGGVEVSGACWFLSAEGESCDTVCGGAGLSYDDATRTYAGSGGTFLQCEEVLDALGDATPPFGDAPLCVSGLGCVADSDAGGNRFRCENPPTDSSSSFITSARACACQ